MDTVLAVLNATEVRSNFGGFIDNVVRVKYSSEYFADFDGYQAAPNRKDHAPYILRALIYDSVNEVAELLHG